MSESQVTTAPEQAEGLEEYLDVFRIILDGSLADWGVAYSIMPAGEKRYWFINRDRFTPFCRKVRGTVRGEEQCLGCTFRHSREAAEEGRPISYLCDAGLIEIAGPVIVRDKHVATIFCGQRRPRDKTGQEEGLRKAKQTERELGFEPGELVELWGQVPTVSQRQVETLEEKLAEVAEYVAKLIDDKSELEEQRAQSVARLRETKAIQGTIAHLGEVVTVDKFWLKVNKALKDICETIGAHYGLVLVSEKGGKVFAVKASSDWRRKALVEKRYRTKENIILSRTLSHRKPLSFDLDDCLEDKLCLNVLDCLPDVLPTSAIAISFDLGDDQTGIMIFVSEPQLATARGGLPFEEEKDILGVIAPQITTAFKNCQLHTERLDLERERMMFIADITHQLTGPLAGIQAHCENLLHSRLSVDRGKKVLRSLVEQSRMGARHLRNFASATRAELGTFSDLKIDLRRQEDMTKLLIECAMNLQGLAASRRIRIRVDEETVDTLLPIAVDELLFKQAVTNILENAVKYSYDDTTITVSASSNAREARLYFTNYGIPLTEEDTSRVFDRYFRTKEAREKVPVGTGIGLFIAKQIIELHGGSISVEPSVKSIEGHKVTFVMALPFRRKR
jgi:signal transduction histidine kinase/ligand-binding sensor protein